MLPSAQVLSQEFDFKHFIDHVFTKFIDAFVKEMINAFSQLQFWSIFDIFDLKKLQQSVKLRKPRNDGIHQSLW